MTPSDGSGAGEYVTVVVSDVFGIGSVLVHVLVLVLELLEVIVEGMETAGGSLVTCTGTQPKY